MVGVNKNIHLFVEKENAWFEDIAHAVQTSKVIHNFSKFQ